MLDGRCCADAPVHTSAIDEIEHKKRQPIENGCDRSQTWIGQLISEYLEPPAEVRGVGRVEAGRSETDLHGDEQSVVAESCGHEDSASRQHVAKAGEKKYCRQREHAQAHAKEADQPRIRCRRIEGVIESRKTKRGDERSEEDGTHQYGAAADRRNGAGGRWAGHDLKITQRRRLSREPRALGGCPG